MKTQTFYIVDVFAEKKYTGNQLAVFRNAKDISDEEMQQIAQEMHFSETTFILSDEPYEGAYDVRIFTPQEELPFAGHPTLGTAYVIQQELIRRPVEQVILRLKVGWIPVTFRYRGERVEEMWMKQINPIFGPTFEVKDFVKMLRLDEDDINPKFPAQEVSTGTPFIIVPLKTLDAVKRARIDQELYFDFIENTQAKAILIFSPDTYHAGNHLNVRVFADYYRVPEDPATGAANGCLAGWLVEHRYFGEDRIDIRVEQGYEIGRPSLLYLKAEAKGEETDIFVGGNVVMVARGEFI